MHRVPATCSPGWLSFRPAPNNSSVTAVVPTCRGSREQAMVHGHWARQDADLSYMNQPQISTMLLVAGFTSLNTHYLSWGHLEPPQYCMDRLFVTPDGVTIDEQIQKLTEVSKLWVNPAYC